MKADYCCYCKEEICEFNENEFYRLNNKIYCSIYCFKEDYDKNQDKEGRSNTKISNGSQTHKSNKRQKKILKKISKSKKRKK